MKKEKKSKKSIVDFSEPDYYPIEIKPIDRLAYLIIAVVILGGIGVLLGELLLWIFCPR